MATCGACHGAVCEVSEEAERTTSRLLANLSDQQRARLEEVFGGRELPTVMGARCFLDMIPYLNQDVAPVESQMAISQPNPGADE